MRGRSRLPRCTKSTGFTLIEVMVAISLLSVVMLALGSALRTIGQTEERVTARLAQADDLRLWSQFLRKTLGRVALLRSNEVVPAGGNQMLFIGARQSIHWVGVMPGNYGSGGRHFFRLMLEENERGQTDLVLRFTPWQGTSRFPDMSGAQGRTVLTRVTEFSLAYEDSQAGFGAWKPIWSEPLRLPSRVQLSVRTGSSAWPMLVVPLRSLPGTNRAGGFTVGGS